MFEETEAKIGAALFVVGAVGLEVIAASNAGAIGLFFAIAIYGVFIAVSVILGVAAAFITAAVLGASFGEIKSAIIKLAGIIAFSSLISVTIGIGWVSGLAFGGLAMWLFELDYVEVVVFSVVMTILQSTLFFGLMTAAAGPVA